MNRLILLGLLLLVFSVDSALPPTSLSGQSHTTKPTTFNFKTPYYQSTQTGGINSLIETDSENMLVNPSFEHGTVATGWTLGTNNTLTATTTSANLFSGAQAGSLTTNATVAFSFKQNVTPVSGLAGTQGEVTWALAVPSGITDGQVCSLINDVEQNCVTVVANSIYREYSIPVVFGTAGQSAGIKFKTTATYASGAQTVYVDKARVRAGIPTQNLLLDNVYTADVTAAGVVSQENVDWITGNASISVTNKFALTLKTGVFGLVPNCVFSTTDASANTSTVLYDSAVSQSNVLLGVRTFSNGTVAALPFKVVCQKQGNDYLAASSTVYSQSNASVYAQVTGAPANTTGGNPLIFPTKTTDTHSGYNASTGQYTIPEKGTYLFSHNTVSTMAAGSKWQIYKGGVLFLLCGNQAGGNDYSTGSCSGDFLKGDIVTLVSDQSGTTYSSSSNWQITKVPNGIIVGSFQNYVSTPSGPSNPVLYSAKLSTSQVVSNEDANWINGNCTNANPTVCTFVTGAFDGVTVPNCQGSLGTACAAMLKVSSTATTVTMQNDAGVNCDYQVMCKGQK